MQCPVLASAAPIPSPVSCYAVLTLAHTALLSMCGTDLAYAATRSRTLPMTSVPIPLRHHTPCAVLTSCAMSGTDVEYDLSPCPVLA
eukprot:3941009-Rhodomonas_salina.8